MIKNLINKNNSIIKPFINNINSNSNNVLIRLYAKKSKKTNQEEREQNEVQLLETTKTIQFSRKITTEEKEANNNYSNNSKDNSNRNRNDNNNNNKNKNINKSNNNNKSFKQFNEKWYNNNNRNNINKYNSDNNNNKQIYNTKEEYNNKRKEKERVSVKEYEEDYEDYEDEDYDVDYENDKDLVEDKKIKSLKEINQIKREETIISHLTPILEIFKKRRQDIVKLIVDHKFYDSNKKEVLPIMKYLTQNKRVYKIITGKDSNETLTKMSGTIHHSGIMAVVKRKYTIPIETLIENEIERVKLFETTPVPTHSFTQHIKGQELNKQKQIQSLGSAARPIIVFLDGVENPMNLGAIARSCALFGVKSIIINNSNNSSNDQTSLNPFSGEAYRSSRGALEHVNISVLNRQIESIECLKEFISNGWELVVTSSNYESKNSVTLYSKGSNKLLGLKPMVIVFGSESKGITKQIMKISTHSLSIPGTGLIESLNVAQAASVVLAECWRIQGKTLELPNEERIELIKSGKGPLEITPQLLGINESDIYNDDISNNNNQKEEAEEDYSDYDYQEDGQYKN